MYIKSRYSKASSRITRRSKVKHFFNIFVKVGLPTAIFVGLILLARADFLQVKGFEILGAETVQSEEIRNVATSFMSGSRFFLVPKSNIFILNKEKLATILLSKFTKLEKVEINKQFLGKKIELTVIERQGDFVWCSKDELCYLMSKNGLVFAEIQKSAAPNKIIFRGNIIENPLLKNFATETSMLNYLKAIEILQSSKFQVFEINVELPDRAVFKTNIGDIILNPEEDLSLTVPNAIILINEIKSKNPSARFNYIDARFGNKVFYKLY